MLTGAIIGVVVALTLMAVTTMRAKKGTGLPGQVEELLRASGPLTLKQVAERLGKDTLLGRGDVVQALGALQSVGKVRVNPAPPGTPQLKKVDVITYEAVGTPPAPPA